MKATVAINRRVANEIMDGLIADYAGDLNDCRKAELKMTDMGLAEEYAWKLASSLCPPNHHGGWLSAVSTQLLYLMATASTTQRCAAMLHVVRFRDC